MTRLEDELRSALRRIDPSEGFADGVLARLRSQPAPSRRARLRAIFMAPRLRWVWLTAAACALLVAVVVRHREVQRERMQGELYKEQVIKALRLTSTKLNAVRQKVQTLDREPPDS